MANSGLELAVGRNSSGGLNPMDSLLPLKLDFGNAILSGLPLMFYRIFPSKGSISLYLSNCTNLQTLDLSSNSLAGPIPPELQFLVKLNVLNLSANHLAGPIPKQLTLCASNCMNLQALDMSSNSLVGPIPPELQFLVKLVVLNLSTNRLACLIPKQLTLYAYLNVIDLHDNQLFRPIPPELGLLVRLAVFDVSNNKFSSPIPASLGNWAENLPRLNANSYEGNNDLFAYTEGKEDELYTQ